MCSASSWEELLTQHNPALAAWFRAALPDSAHTITQRLEAALRREELNTKISTDDHRLQEFTESVHNLALARLGAHRRQLSIRKRSPHCRSAFAYAAWRHAVDPRFSPLAFFEQCITEGHRLHPGSRVRVGMTPHEILAYAPEWTDEVNLPLVGVHRDHIEDMGLDVLLSDEHGMAIRSARSELRAAGLEPSHYTVIPAHPWQVDRIIPDVFRTEIESKKIIPLSVGLRARPLASLRTLAPIGTKGQSHFKTAIGVRLTGAIRGVSVDAAHNGPRISALLETISRQERDLPRFLTFLHETASATFIDKTPATENIGHTRAPMLGCIARTNPEHSLKPDEFAIPLAALWAPSPVTGETLLTDWLTEHSKTDAMDFARAWAATAIPPLLILWSRYGIALEAHAQNSLMILTLGGPQRLAVRDWGSIRIHRGRLQRHGLDITLTEHTAIETTKEGDLHTRITHALVFDHLGGLIPALSTTGNIPEKQLWQPFRATACAAFRMISQCCEHCARNADVDSRKFFAPTAPHKAHVRMRLEGATHNAQYVQVSNPLSEPSFG